MELKPEISLSRALDFPDLEPAPIHRRRPKSGVVSRSLELSPKIELIHDSACDEAVTPSARAEPRNEIARLTVYTLNAILMVIAFPVGLGMLIFNIVGGENLRTTAHAIALTGMTIGLSMTPLGQALMTGF